MSSIPKITVSELLDAGVHFGHKTSRWNPKMAPYIYGARDGIHIIDLQQTVPLMHLALKQIYETVRNNGKVLFVSSKVQATDLIAEYSEKCGQFYVNHRWLGGTLTNWATISRSIKTLDQIEKELEDEETLATYTKKEVLNLTRKKDKLLRSFSGIRKIGGNPDLMVVIDTNREHLAIEEASKLGIPIIAVVDSNSNSDKINFPIPGNDDAIRSIRLYCELFANAALNGISDALSESGVDIGAAMENSDNEGVEGVVKLNKSAKAKAKPTVTKKEAETKSTKQATTKKAVEPKKETATTKKATEVKKEPATLKKAAETKKPAAAKAVKEATTKEKKEEKATEAKKEKTTSVAKKS
ncbi:MAG: 30S ribosomal protein S2 [Rickettsiaceae bacterium]|nr:30S ribosomal protein S2 [Rickettsiaceae bacterium]